MFLSLIFLLNMVSIYVLYIYRLCVLILKLFFFLSHMCYRMKQHVDSHGWFFVGILLVYIICIYIVTIRLRDVAEYIIISWPSLVSVFNIATMKLPPRRRYCAALLIIIIIMEQIIIRIGLTQGVSIYNFIQIIVFKIWVFFESFYILHDFIL